jgi:hypothetical protein
LLAVFTVLLGTAAYLFVRSRPLVITLSEAQVQQRLGAAFPVRKEVLVVAEVVLSRPQVTLTPGSDRVGFATDCAVHLLGNSVIQGRARLSGGLRYDTANNALFVQDARVERLHVPGLPPRYEAAVTVAASQAAREYLGKRPIYHLPGSASVAVPLLGERHVRSVAVESGLLKIVLTRGH